MDNKLPTIVISFIFVIFLIFTSIYLLSSRNVRDNTITDINNNANTNNNFNANNNIDIYNENNQIERKEKVTIASYTTNIYDNDKNRVHNIKLACENLNGTIVKKDEEFSFNDKLGNMGANEGYKKATGFDSNGNNIKVYGGGICQLSSTLYNAVLIAKLDVTERHAHSKRVYYVPKDKDATVFAGGPDFKFKNNSDYDILIEATSDGYTVKVSLIQEKIGI